MVVLPVKAFPDDRLINGCTGARSSAMRLGDAKSNRRESAGMRVVRGAGGADEEDAAGCWEAEVGEGRLVGWKNDRELLVTEGAGTGSVWLRWLRDTW